MASDIKKYEAAYKKLNTFTKDEVRKAANTINDVKYFRYDMVGGLDQLEDSVLELKADSPIKATSIDDFAKINKDVRVVLKDVQFNEKKVNSACKELRKLKLPKIGLVRSSLKKLQSFDKEITADLKDLKKNSKGDKSIKLIEKLQKQVEIDVAVSKDFEKLISEGIPKEYFEADKLYKNKIRAIMVAKPRLSSKTVKFRALEPKMLKKSIMKSNVKQCEKMFKTIDKAAELAVASIKANKSKEGVKHWQSGEKELKKLVKLADSYMVIEKKYPDQIEKSWDNKAIEKAMKDFAEIKTKAEERWEAAETETKGS